MSLFYQSVRFLLKGYFFLFYQHKTYGQEHIPKGAGLIAANHASYFDPPILAASFPTNIHFLARSSLFKNKFFAFLIRNLHAHPLMQEQGDTQAFRLALQLLEKGNRIVIFPEGERTSTGELQQLKGGASKIATRAKVPIIPVYIVGTWSAWPKTKKYPSWRGKTACVIGSPLYTMPLKAHKKEAQKELNVALEKKLESLKTWYEAGAQGSPP